MDLLACRWGNEGPRATIQYSRGSVEKCERGSGSLTKTNGEDLTKQNLSAVLNAPYLYNPNRVATTTKLKGEVGMGEDISNPTVRGLVSDHGEF